jgi:ribbon-helix-helix CopG family protein
VNDTKVLSVRMPSELAAQIDAMARAEGASISERCERRPTATSPLAEQTTTSKSA